MQTTEVEPKLRGQKISASNRRVIVTRLVAEAHKRVHASIAPKLYDLFQSMALLPISDPSVIKPHAIPSYVYSPLSDIELQVQQDVNAHLQTMQRQQDEASSSSNLSIVPPLSLPAKRSLTQTSLSQFVKRQKEN